MVGRKTDTLREESVVPGVVYGPKAEPINVQVKHNDLVAVFRTVGRSSLVDLEIAGGKTAKVIIQDVQRDPIKDDITHADFYQVDMTKEVSATVRLEFTGSSVAVKELGGTLVKARNTVEVKGLPDKLVGSIEVDITKLETFDDVIHVKDVPLPEGLVWDMDDERAVALVNPPRTEEQMAALEEAPEEVEVTGADEAEEGEEGEEGKKDGDEAKDSGESDKKGDGGESAEDSK